MILWLIHTFGYKDSATNKEKHKFGKKGVSCKDNSLGSKADFSEMVLLLYILSILYIPYILFILFILYKTVRSVHTVHTVQHILYIPYILYILYTYRMI